MTVSEEAVWAALRTVQDPELHRDLVSLNMVRDLAIGDGGQVSFKVVLTTPACPMRAQIEGDVKAAVMRVPGVKKVVVDMGAQVTGAPRKEQLAPGVRNIIGIASGKGGVGKSTVSANLACALARAGARVGLLDADIYGPNQPIMFGLLGEQPEVVRRTLADGQEVDLLVPQEKFGVRLMSMGFLIDDHTPVVWRGPMLNTALKQFFGQVEWGELDYLLIDLPPGTGDVQISLIQLVKLAGIVHVTTPQDVALQDVRKGIMMFRQQNIPLLGVIENMGAFVCPHCGEETPVFSTGGGKSMAEALEVPFLGSLPLDPQVRVSGDGGVPVVVAHPDSPTAVQFMRIAEQLAAQVSIANFERDGVLAAPGT